MAGVTPNPKKRGYLLPPGCKDLIHVLNGPPPKPFLGKKTAVNINGQITAPFLRVIGDDGQQLGIMSRAEALKVARSKKLDLLEIAPTAKPPVCRLVDYGKYRYEQSKKRKK